MDERRTARRYDLSLPVIVRTSNERVSRTREARTRDISTRGLYFTVDEDLKAGSELDMTLTLPAEMTHGVNVLVRAFGRVVRADERKLEDGTVGVGVAAVIERYDIIHGENDKAR